MKLVSSYQVVEEAAKRIDELTQQDNIPKKALIIVTKQENEQAIKNLTDIKVDSISEQDARNIDVSDEYKLSESAASLFSDTIKRGGFVILKDQPERNRGTAIESEMGKNNNPPREDESEKSDFESEIDDHISAPGFGVDFKKSGADSKTQEDNFNPDNHSENTERN